MHAVAAVVVTVLALAGCTGDSSPDESEVVASGTPVPEVSAPDSSRSPEVDEAPSVAAPTSAIVATATDSSVDVYDAPDGNLVSTVAAEDVLTVPDQTPLTFLVQDEDASGEWVQVHLPIRPNGSTGWISVDSVTLGSTTMRIEIDLDDFELTVHDGEDVVLESAVGVGRADRPTPGGVYYIRELLQPPNPDGVYGPYAYGLSGYSPVLDSFAGGDAVIGIHGTDEPDSIGTLASSGCIRLPNDAITELVTEVGLPLGTPVYVS
ncbi:L,D-transpeptidase [Demequina sp. NBRC 110053]|uniref:L,D-transpeptidase n=1 Tax=Demequina sp. NBRC 110053 TaxID=1570342 RepID=UPI0013566007|nr:L,D-transpeptidase family protein [Demequina sp. NBRC 110053]